VGAEGEAGVLLGRSCFFFDDDDEVETDALRLMTAAVDFRATLRSLSSLSERARSKEL
jgi:hypothetical protein